MIDLANFVFNELNVNSFVLYDQTQECIVVDPGCNTKSQQDELQQFINSHELKPVCIVNTHGHFDHVFGNAWAKSTFQCPLRMHINDLPLIQHADKYAGLFGYTVDASPMPDSYLHDGEILHFGDSSLLILHVPGHSPGSICLYSAEAGFIIAGDVLFRGSIGRTDFPGGNYDLLISGIREKLLTLPSDTIVLPGHGPKTTIGLEHDTNPFFK
jgi:glyoxylase-like metal-dependent hydrolase (beta-lactamase superfamily II)